MKNTIKIVVSLILVAFTFVGPYSLRQGVYYYKKTAEVTEELREALIKKQSLEAEIKDKINKDISSRNGVLNPTKISDIDSFIRNAPNSKILSLTVISINAGEISLLNTVSNVNEAPDAQGFEYKLEVSDVAAVVKYLGDGRLYIESLRASYPDKTVTIRVNLRGH